MVLATWSPIHDTRGSCPYVPGYYFGFFNNIALILITNYLHKQNTALINFFFFMWQQTKINNILNLAVAHQQRNDLTA